MFRFGWSFGVNLGGVSGGHVGQRRRRGGCEHMGTRLGKGVSTWKEALEEKTRDVGKEGIVL